MSVKLKYTERCVDCGGKLNVGQEARFDKDGNGKLIWSHPGRCPEDPFTRSMKGVRPVPETPARPDPEDSLEFRKCADCGALWAFEGPPPIDRCPSIHPERERCGGKWLKGDPEKEGWAVS